MALGHYSFATLLGEQGHLPFIHRLCSLRDSIVFIMMASANTTQADSADLPTVLPSIVNSGARYQFTIGEIGILGGSLGDDQITGDQNENWIFGFDGDDQLDGQGGSDRLFGGEGNDQLFGGAGDDQLFGEAGDDQLDGGAGNDYLQGGLGADRLNGGEGIDTADYSDLGRAITLRYAFDFVPSPPSDPQATSTTSATNNALVAIPQWQLTKLAPTNSAASRYGRGDADSLRTKPNSDTLSAIEVIIAPQSQTNTLDFSYRTVASQFDPTPAVSAPAIAVDLATGALSFDVAGTPQSLTVKNFVQVIGSYGNDQITGDSNANYLDGGAGEDVLIGGEGNDILRTTEQDSLTGGLGADQFQIGAVWAAYSGRSGFKPRSIQPSTIEDFNSAEQDRLVLSSKFETGLILADNRALQYIPFYRLTPGALSEAEFLIQGQGSTTDATRIIYDNQTGDVFYQGPGLYRGLTSPVKIAVLAGAPTLQASDIVVI